MLLFVSTKAKQPTASGNSETETTCFLQLMPRLLTKTKQKSENKERPPHHISSSLVPPAPSVFWVQLTIRLFMLMIYTNVYRWVLICSALAGQACQGSLAPLIAQLCFHLVKTKNACCREHIQPPHPTAPSRMNTPTEEFSISAAAASRTLAWELCRRGSGEDQADRHATGLPGQMETAAP